MKNENLKKDLLWNLIGSLFNACTSFFFLIIVTRINGVEKAGVFTFAFANACLLQVIGIYATRSYQVTEKNKDIKDTDYIYTKVITCFIMFFIGIIFCIIKNYNSYKSLIVVGLIIYKALDAFSESFYAIMQKNNKLYKVGFSLFIKGIFGTIIFLAVDLLFNNLLLSIFLLIMSNAFIIIFYDYKVIKKIKYEIRKFDCKKVFLIIKLSFWTFLFTILMQYLVNAPKYAIDNYLSSNEQTIYGIISMPASIMVLISNFIIHPFLVKIDDNIKQKKYNNLNSILLKMILSVIVIAILGLVLCYFIGVPILNLLYKIRLDNYLKDLLLIITGASIFAITIIISNVLIALRKTMSQTIIYVITSIFAYIISRLLVSNLSITGASYSYLLSMSILLILYLIIYIYIIKKEVHNE